MRDHRFKVDDVSGARIRVDGSEARHALRVLRLGVGDVVTLFDGRCGEALCRIESVEGEAFEVTMLERSAGDATSAVSLVIATATPKGNRADWMIEKCAELGVARVCLLETERGEVRPGAGKLERWRRKAHEAAKQSGRSVTMAIDAPAKIEEIVASIAAIGADDTSSAAPSLWYGSPVADVVAARPLGGPGTARNPTAAKTIVFFVGPEGGFTDAEIRRIESCGGRPMRLSNAVLRVETAAIAAAAVFGYTAMKSD